MEEEKFLDVRVPSYLYPLFTIDQTLHLFDIYLRQPNLYLDGNADVIFDGWLIGDFSFLKAGFFLGYDFGLIALKYLNKWEVDFVNILRQEEVILKGLIVDGDIKGRLF